MKNVMCAVAVATAATFAVVGIPTDANAAKKDSTYSRKNAECKRRAAKMHFGIHWIKRNRWIKDCIAGGHPA